MINWIINVSFIRVRVRWYCGFELDIGECVYCWVGGLEVKKEV